MVEWQSAQRSMQQHSIYSAAQPAPAQYLWFWNGNSIYFGVFALQAVEHMEKCGRGAESVNPMVQALQQYTLGRSPYDMPVAGTTPQGWWDLVQRAGGYPDLVRLGTAMADAVPHAASLERIFSLMGWLHSKLRNRQSHGTTTAMTTIRTHWQRRTAKIIPANTLGQPYMPVIAPTAATSAQPAATSATAAATSAAEPTAATSSHDATVTSEPSAQAPTAPTADLWTEAARDFADQVLLDEEADAKMWQDLPTDVDVLADADEMDTILESFYTADLSNELAPDAAELHVSSEVVEANDVFQLEDSFFDVTQETIAVPVEADMSLMPTSRSGPSYNAAAMVDMLLG